MIVQGAHAEEQAAADSLQLHSLVIQNMAEGVCLLAPTTGTILYANPRFTEIFGYAPGELDGRPIATVNYDDGKGLAESRAREIMDAILQHGRHTFEVQNVKKDGTPFWCRGTASVFDHPTHGKVLVTVQEDIGEQKRTAALLAESERKYRTLVENAYDSILTMDAQGRIVVANEQLGRKFGYVPEELIGQLIEILLPLRFRQRHVLSRNAYLRDPYPRPMTAGRHLSGLKKDGTEFPVDISLSPMATPDGVQVIAVIRDVTDRTRLEDQQKFLGDLGKILGETLEALPLMERTAAALVPRFADFAAIGLITDAGFEFKASHGADETQRTRLAEALRNLASEKPPSSARGVAATGKALWIESLGEPGFGAAAIVPIAAHGKPSGTLALLMAERGRAVRPEDVPFFEMVANRLALALEKARLYSEAKNAVKAREAVLSAVSHDLRNPLFVVESTSHRLLDETLPPEEFRDLVTGLLAASHQMRRLVTDLLDFGKIESGGFSVHRERVDPKDVLTNALESLTQQCERRGIHLKVVLPSELPALFCDGDRIVQVLWNLVGNAVKFTPSGKTITLSAMADAGFIHFSVADEGCGIASEDLGKIFDRYWQAKTGAKGGSGLGLWIAQCIVRAHGGDIRVESQLNRGSTFTFSLPLAPAEGVTFPPALPLPKAAPGGASNVSLEGMRILVADDSPENLKLVAGLLKSRGAAVSVAQNAQQAMRLLNEADTDLILTDVEMPGGDGYELLHEIRRRGKGRKIPVVACTGHSSQLDRAKLEKEGFDAIVTKPFSPKTLLDSLVPFGPSH